MDTPGATNNNRDCPQAQTLPPPPRRDSDGEVVFYIEEPKASKYTHTYYYYTYAFAVPTNRFVRVITHYHVVNLGDFKLEPMASTWGRDNFTT